jgi:hypothetical protein
LERKPSESRSLSKWLGSLGKYGEPPDYYFIHAAAKELGMSYVELEDHPERERLMTIAFTLSHGRDDGEHMMQCNPEFIRMQKKRSDEQTKAAKRGKAG